MLKLFKIYGLFVLLLLKKKKTKQEQPMTNIWSASFTQRLQVVLPRPEALQFLPLLTSRASMQFCFRDQVREPNLLSYCFSPSIHPLCQFFINLISSHKSLIWRDDCVQPWPWTQEKKYLSVTKRTHTSLLCQEERSKRVNHNRRWQYPSLP